MTLSLRGRVAAFTLTALLAGGAHAQFGNIMNRLPGGLGNLINTPSQPAAAGASDLLTLLRDAGDKMDEPREIELGAGMAAVLLGAKPLDPDMKLQRYVNTLGRWISLQSTRPNLPWVFAVLKDDGFNAFAAPGGYIFVTRGLVDRVDEAELAGILAHEITHVTSKHHLKAVQKKALTGVGAALLVQWAARGRDVAGVQGVITDLTKQVFSSGLDQADEFEADRDGVALAARSGFDPYGLASVLQQLRTVPRNDQMFSLTFKTHPSPESRLESLESSMGTRLDAFTGKPSVPVSQRLR